MDIFLVLTILIFAVVLFAMDRFPIDMVAMIVLAALLITGVVSAREAVSGFSNPATITVAAMFVLSAGLQRIGAVRMIGRMIIRWGKQPVILLFLVMLTVGISSMFINNTGVIAVFLPLVLAAAARRKVSPSKLLIPMSYASQAAGVCTLIGTSTNILVSAISDKEGFGPFSMFELGQLGIILFSATVIYFLIFGRFLLPARRGEELSEAYNLGEYIAEMRVLEGSPLIGKTILDSKLTAEHEVIILRLIRGDKAVSQPLQQPLHEHDVLLVEGKIKDLMYLKDTEKLELEPEFTVKDETFRTEDLILVEAMVAPHSRLIGHTLRGLDFQRRFQATALAIKKQERTLYQQLNSVRLNFGDVLLLQGRKEAIEKLQRNENLIVLEEIEEASPVKGKAKIGIAIIMAVVLLATFNVVPIMVSAILGCLAMMATGCINMDKAYETIDWQIIFLLAGVLPLGAAMANTGAAELIATSAVNMVSHMGPYAVLAMLYIITAVLTEGMSNNAAAVLLAPIAISVAQQLGVNPKPFLVAVTYAASTSFATPIGYQTNAMVFTPGGYRYLDFIKVGVPLNLIFWGLVVFFIPKFWHF